MKLKLVTFILLSLLPISTFATSYPEVSRAYRVTLDMDMFIVAMERYIKKFGEAPNIPDGLNALVKENMMKHIPLDPWGMPYNYIKNNKRDYEIWSFGKDNLKGGSGINYDFSTKTLKENERNKQQVFEKYHGK